MKTLKYLLFIILSLSILIFLACGGGGGDGASSGTSSNSSAGTGSVAIFLADGPADEYDHIWITVNKVTLIPSEGEHVVVYQSSKGYELDILAYRDEDFLLTMKRKIPAGTYEKIRLGIADIKSDGGPCDDMEVKLPSGKIDLVPREPFEVEQGEILAIRLDIDANKSINFHEAGQSGKCIFRPVIFVDSESVEWMPRCPKILNGKLEAFIGKDGVEGFRLALSQDRGTLDVYVSETTVIFDEAGRKGDFDDLEEGPVWVRGKLDSEGHFQASEVAIGDVLVLKGTVDSAIDEDDTFTLVLDPGQSVADPTIPVTLSDKTLILVGCDNEVTKSAIKPGLPARVAGKLSLDKQILQAIAIFLKPISGELISVQEDVEHNSTSGIELTIRVNEDTDVVVFLPDTAVIRLVGDGDVPVELLCPGRQVNAVIDPEKSDELSVLTASEIKVQSDHLAGYVDEIERTERIIVIDGQQILVQDNAVVMDLRGSGDRLRDFEYINDGDKVSCFGLKACEADTSENDFYAFVILLIED